MNDNDENVPGSFMSRARWFLRLSWLSCVKGAVAERLRDCQRRGQLRICPKSAHKCVQSLRLGLRRSTSLYTREARNSALSFALDDRQWVKETARQSHIAWYAPSAVPQIVHNKIAPQPGVRLGSGSVVLTCPDNFSAAPAATRLCRDGISAYGRCCSW